MFNQLIRTLVTTLARIRKNINNPVKMHTILSKGLLQYKGIACLMPMKYDSANPVEISGHFESSAHAIPSY